jgi:DNA modification methylase
MIDFIDKIFNDDNLTILKQLPGECVNLCYIDPPFKTNRNFIEFTDKFDGMDGYINFIRPRIKEIHRTLKSNGSFYLHCDWRSDAYLRILCDEIFGKTRFINPIVWKRTDARCNAYISYGVVTDTILFYVKGNERVFHPQRLSSHTERQLIDYKFDDKSGKYYKMNDLTVAYGLNKFTWRGTTLKNRAWLYNLERLEEMLANGEVKCDAIGKPLQLGHVQWFDEIPFKAIDNLWLDIPRVANVSSNRNGYSTQKPEKLLERIILTSSNPDDIVLDCFCGSGTTLKVAKSLGRHFIGIDINKKACDISRDRVNEIEFGSMLKDIEITKRRSKERQGKVI